MKSQKISYQKLLAAIPAVVVALTFAAPAARAGDDSGSGVSYYSQLSCGKLWYERNSILANYGYCFQTQRALAAFGNTCRPPFGKLPGHLNRVVNEIRGYERRRGCG